MSSEVTPAQTQTADIVSPIVTTGPQPVVASPIVEPAAPAAAVEVVAPTEPVVPTTPETPPLADTIPEGVQKRINELTALRRAAERQTETERDARIASEARAVELLAQLTAKNVDPNNPTPAPAGLTQADVEKLAQEKAVEMAARAEFNKTCNAVVETGKQEFAGSWDDAVKNLNLVGALGTNVAPDFLETALEMKNPHKILHHFGSNLDQAEKLLSLPPKKMAIEMARIEASLNAPAPAVVAPVIPVSNAPAPVIPVTGGAKPGTPSIDDPNLSTEEFMRLRSEQQLARQKRYLRA